MNNLAMYPLLMKLEVTTSPTSKSRETWPSGFPSNEDVFVKHHALPSA